MRYKNSSLLQALGKPGVHEQKIAEIFHGKTKFHGSSPVFEKPLTVMAFTNRCGSNLLADYLRQTGKIGGFHESLNYDTVVNLDSRIENFPSYIISLFERFAANGCLGVKASWDQVAMLSRFNIIGMFPGVRLIHMRRSDVISQAVSHWIAHQTKKWTSAQEGEKITPSYSHSSIDSIILNINESNSLIPILSEAIGAPLTGILYEALVRDPQKSIDGLGKAIGLDFSNWHYAKPTVEKQADALNRKFCNLFRAEIRELLVS